MAAVASPVDPTSSSGRWAKPDADAASDHSSSSADRRDSEALAQFSTKSEEYRLLFRLPTDEVLVQDFNCALQENILLQGHMYLFIHHICFYSNIFGFETKKIISFNEITCVRKAKTAAIFPNAIEIVTEEKRHFFGSFLSRDEAYRLIVDGWAQHNNEVKALLERQDSKSETSCQDIGTFILERVQTSKASEDDSSFSVRIKEVNILEPSKPLLDGNMEINTVIKPSEIEASDAEEKATMHSGNQLTWNVEDVDAPMVPDQFTLAAEVKFPVLVDDFFNLFISDQSVGFIEDFHQRCGDKDFQCTPWQQHGQTGHERKVSFLHPVKIYLGAKFGQCQETQKFRVYRNSHLMIETSQVVSDVPFADYFQVEGIWDVEQDKNGEHSCTLRVYSNVAFSKKTIFRGKIEQSTKDEYRDVCALWISMAKDLLKKNPVEQLKGVADQSPCIIQEVEVKGPSLPEKSPETSHPVPRSTRISHASRNPSFSSSPAARKVIHDDSSYAVAVKTVQRDSNQFSSVISLISKFWISTVSYFKAQSPLFCVSVAFLAILLLFQVCFIFHVTRIPEVRIVIHDSSLNDIAGFNRENIQFLEKRFNYLKDSMALLETQMDSMRHEYTLLKTHLERLEQLKTKLRLL